MSRDSNVERWIELSRQYRDNPAGPSVLPVVKVGERHFFVDERLRQLRNVENADEWLNFESDGDLLVFVMQHGGIVS